MDFVKFQATTGAFYTIATSNISGGADIFLGLYGSDVLTEPDAWLLASSDGSGRGGFPRLAWQAPQSGTYYVKVRERFNRGDCLWYYIYVTGGFEVFVPIVRVGTSHRQATPLRLPSIMSTRSWGVGRVVPSVMRANLSLANSPTR